MKIVKKPSQEFSYKRNSVLSHNNAILEVTTLNASKMECNIRRTHAYLLFIFNYVCQSHSHVQLFVTHGLWPARLPCPWDSPGKNTGVGCHFHLEGIFLTQGSNPGLLHCRQILYHLSYREVHI